jgi:hypothetical protein
LLAGSGSFCASAGIKKKSLYREENPCKQIARSSHHASHMITCSGDPDLLTWPKQENKEAEGELLGMLKFHS